MASSLAAQLAQIAANSRTSLNAKALKATHSKSLIWEPRVAAGQTFAEIYQLSYEGFEELCNLDARFTHYGASLFSEQSQEADRIQMNAEENAALDKRVDSFLHLVGSRLRLMPAIKAIEWLIRRFRIHEFNTATLITTFLPYHTIPAFVTLLSILPAKIPLEYRFLDPYIRSLTAPPRAAIVQQATNRPELLSIISQYTLESCRARQEYPGLVSFWGGVMAEAANGMLDKMRSGRRSIQLENDHILLQQIGPVLSEAMVMKEVPGIQIASYMIVTILAAKGSLNDVALTAFMDQLVHGWNIDTYRPGLVCLCILAQHRAAKQVSSRIAKALIKVQDLVPTLVEISRQHRVDKLANGLALAFIERLSKKGDVRSLPAINSLLSANLLRDKQIKVIYKSMLLAAHKVNDEVDEDGHIRKEIGASLISLSQAGGDVGDVIRSAIEEIDFNIEELELKLGAAIRPKLAIEQSLEEAGAEEETMAVENKPSLDSTFQELAKLQPSTVSCLSQDSSSLFNDLCAVLLSAAATESAMEKFDSIPALSRPLATSNPFYLSFYMRVWCGPFPTLAKVAALERVKFRLKETDCADKDFQAIIPYCAVALSDPAKKVRRAAADLVAVLGSLVKEQTQQVWGAKDLYGKVGAPNALDRDALKALVSSVLVPSLEESVLHEAHVVAALVSALESSKGSSGTEGGRRHLSHAARLSILKFLCGHVTETPLLTVKIRLLRSLNQIRSISGTSRTDLLLPLLRWWAALGHEEVIELTARESLDEAAVDEAVVDVVIANHTAGLETAFELINDPKTALRPHLVQAIFGRIIKMWPSMKSDTKFSTARSMFNITQTLSSSEHGPVITEAVELLRKVELTTDIQLDLIDSLQDQVKLATEKPANKRRRVSTTEQSRSVGLQSNPELKSALNKTTFVLELVQESDPANHPELLPSLFTTLSDLHHLSTLIGSELGYLQNLVLSSLLAMMPAYKDNKNLTIDASVGHGDILATCIQKSSSPAVINAALLLVASLARTAPDVVLQSVMPIFTFMGSSVLKQADDYSAHVVNQTIKEVIPPLIDTFRRRGRNVVASTKDLLASFVTAYEHIPSHRKHDLFISLVQNLGPEDFLFAILAMFVDRYAATDNMISFTTQMMSSFSVEIQLQTLIKLLDLTSDIFKPKPSLSNVLLGGDGSEHDTQKVATKQLNLLPHLLSNRRLKREITQLAERDDMETGKIRDLYATLLESILTLATTVKNKKALYNRCGDALSNLLNLLSIAEFIKSVEALLDRPNVGLRQKVLRALELRVDSESTADPRSREALLAFLPQLTAVIRESDDMSYKHTAVTCVDKISEKYGKKDLDAVAAAAATIAGDYCLGQSSQSLRVMALLCLASLVDVLQDGIVPVLPVAIPKALDYLEQSLVGEEPNAELHNAAYAFVAALAQHIPYMITGSYLDRLLACSNASAAAALDDESSSNRTHCLQFLAKLVDPKVMYNALNQNWASASSCGASAVSEYLDILGMALDKHSKAAVAKNVVSLSAIFLSAMDLRRTVASGQAKTAISPSELDEIETKIGDDALKMIYKLNDAAFRPIFSKLMEWASTGLPKNDASDRTLRLFAVYGFLDTFFGNLKSIVTSYASYIVESAVTVLSSTNFQDADEKELWKRVLRTLGKCFEHDQDGFWQAPAHFGAVAPVLVEQFLNAGAADATEDLIPALVELAAAADSQEHHKELNGTLLKHLRNGQAAVRLAVVQCQQALTVRLGEEWLQALPEMLPYISELQDDDDEVVERENRRWIVEIEEKLGESLDSMLQ
ncbi:U3 small nucleolar RNA-associated protein 10 [Chaetomium tenue]|uniref:U3 small nucleolar RNA-associated protein 10 n=1 Tax=Chaetomium tenue TaxID=1854479 RepID=A0ACB7PDY7_9PEZI|nr:U3 small nucleolar RNA-associated protein 10 [Chaetomium globosum]